MTYKEESSDKAKQKKLRHKKIKEIFDQDVVINSHATLISKLKNNFKVEQATISRDLRELGYVYDKNQGKYIPKRSVRKSSLLSEVNRLLVDSNAVVHTGVMEMVLIKSSAEYALLLSQKIEEYFEDNEDFKGALPHMNGYVAIYFHSKFKDRFLKELKALTKELDAKKRAES
ncbi:hypothetical protein KP77_28530 [Jeotgalibacillus alimentarius]|uniref:Arginine repressor DNA-binding domain-containing protein n=1 Tax=Jeotgalibacillus alimentarius TaxID=135826 RepID=A0A0C2VMA2_9BACL|nr:hypothetical protein [Jeotgalibacillus alimentarius]KIL45561.1 hypothetical protein KP77_28530 [Jeotgalibacillus alimentarius]